MKLDEALLQDYLLCDASQPLISNGCLEEELSLYHISPPSATLLFEEFYALTGKELSPKSLPEELSGGQKVLLMALLALHSPASKIIFIDLFSALDQDKRLLLKELIERYSTHREIRMESGTC